MLLCVVVFFFFQAEDGIRDLVRSRGLGDVYKRQEFRFAQPVLKGADPAVGLLSRDDPVENEAIADALSLIHI